MIENLSPADQLLVLGAGTRLSDEAVDSVRGLLQQPIDWRTVRVKAQYHRVAPLLYRTLSELADPSVPADLLEALAGSYHECAARNLAHAAALEEILAALRDAGVEVMVLKGAALAESVYGSLALRPMIDLDVLVRAADLATAEEVMEGLGYTPPPGALPAAYYRGNHIHIPYQSRRRDVKVDLHHSLQEDVGWLQPDLEEIWRGARRRRLAGTEALVMGLEDLLLYLCLHLDKHGYYNRYLLCRPDAAAVLLRHRGANRLIRFCDLREVLERHRTEVDWPRLAAKARRWGIEEAVSTSLSLVSRVFGPSVVTRVPAGIRPPRLRWVEATLYAAILELEAPAAQRRGLRRWLRRRLLEENNRLQFRPIRLIGMLRHLFPGREAITRRHGVAGWTTVLLYLRHILRTLARSGRQLARLVYYSVRRSPRLPAPERR